MSDLKKQADDERNIAMLDLIVRQQEEIAALKSENEELRKQHKELREANLYLNERLREAIKELHPLKGRQEIAALKRENEELRKAAHYLCRRPYIASGSLEMAEGDALCKGFGLEPWKRVE